MSLTMSGFTDGEEVARGIDDSATLGRFMFTMYLVEIPH